MRQMVQHERVCFDHRSGSQSPLEIVGVQAGWAHGAQAALNGQASQVSFQRAGKLGLAQTARRARPLARRALMTLRPPLVFMRTRKPWVRARRVLEGW